MSKRGSRKRTNGDKKSREIEVKEGECQSEIRNGICTMQPFGRFPDISFENYNLLVAFFKYAVI